MTGDAWALRAFRWSYVAFIVWASGRTFVAQWESRGLHGGQFDARFILALSGSEIACALAFLVEPLEIAAAGLLLSIYAIAAALTLMQGEAPLRFLYYGATVAYIVLAHKRMRASSTVPDSIRTRI